MFDHIKTIIQNSIAETAPMESLFQARDIFETILAATRKSGAVPKITMSTAAESDMVKKILAQNKIIESPSFESLLGCTDLLLNSPTNDNIFQVKYLFRILLKSL